MLGKITIMQNRYYLKGLTINAQEELEITELEWEKLESAKSIVSNIIYIEQKYDLMISNYFSFEKELLVQSLDNAVRNRKQDWLQVEIVSLTRQIVNLISSIKIYVDHVKKRHVTKLPLDKDRQIELLEELSDCEKNSTSYKFIKNLRNYVVHRSLPIDSYTTIHSWEKIESEDEEKLGHVIKPFVKKEKLLSDRKFSTTVVKKIAGNDEKIDLRFPIRKTVARLSKFNESFREKISSDYDEAKK